VPRPAGSGFCRSGVLWLAQAGLLIVSRWKSFWRGVKGGYLWHIKAPEFCRSLSGSTEKDGRPLQYMKDWRSTDKEDRPQRFMKDRRSTGKDGRPLHDMKARVSSWHRCCFKPTAGTRLAGMPHAEARRERLLPFRRALAGSGRVADRIAMEVILARGQRRLPVAYQSPGILPEPQRVDRKRWSTPTVYEGLEVDR